MTNDSISVQERSQFLPALSIHESVARRNEMVAFVKECMVKGVDYGEIPGTGRDGKEGKSVLYKPGAEKLCTLFGFSPRFSLVEKVEDWTGQDHGGEPLFYYLYRCSMWRGNTLMAEGDGSCNTFESKYRYRKAERVCPKCKKDTIIKGNAQYGGGWLCFAKKGGCGAKFPDDDSEIKSQVVGRVPNPDVCDMVNTVQKMAQKRALIAVCLIAVNASEFFTQDMEDFAPTPEQHADKAPDVPVNVNRETGEIYEASFVENAPEPELTPAQALNVFEELVQGMGYKGKPGKLAIMILGSKPEKNTADVWLKCAATDRDTLRHYISEINEEIMAQAFGEEAKSALKHAVTPEPNPQTPADHTIQEGEDSNTAFMRVTTHYGWTGNYAPLVDLLEIEPSGSNAEDYAQGLTRPAGMWQAAIAKLHEESARRRRNAGETAQSEMEAL